MKSSGPQVKKEFAAIWPVLSLSMVLSSDAQRTNLELVVVDKESGERVACRIHLKNAGGQPVKVEGMPAWRDHFVCRGQGDLNLPAGAYSFEIERGPEYLRATGLQNYRLRRAGLDRP